ncbi:MAG TPA: energy transducer TonB [Myxococcales bacterium]
MRNSGTASALTSAIGAIRPSIAPFIFSSLFLHLGLLAALNTGARGAWLDPRPRGSEVVAFEVVSPPLPKIEPEVEAQKIRPKPPPIKIAERTRLTPRPKTEAPPPPDSQAEPSPEPVPLVVGLSMSSTTAAGGVAVPIGNTLYGKAEGRGTADTAAPSYTPFNQLDGRPEVLTEFDIPYPEPAKRGAIDGDVVLSVDIDLGGKVTGAKVISGPGHGLNEAAMEGIYKFRFKPAIKRGKPTSTTVPFTYHFILN